MKAIYTALLGLVLVAAAGCAKGGSDSSVSTPLGGGSASGNGSGVGKSTNDVTDYSQCNQGPTATQIEGTWHQSFQQSDLLQNIVINIGSNGVELSNECSLNGRSLIASVYSPSYHDSFSFQVTGHDEATQKIDEPGFHMECHASVQPYRVNYTFRGSCLVMSDPNSGQKMVMLPGR
jgi:hypothetical protein